MDEEEEVYLEEGDGESIEAMQEIVCSGYYAFLLLTFSFLMNNPGPSPSKTLYPLLTIPFIRSSIPFLLSLFPFYFLPPSLTFLLPPQLLPDLEDLSDQEEVEDADMAPLRDDADVCVSLHEGIAWMTHYKDSVIKLMIH